MNPDFNWILSIQNNAMVRMNNKDLAELHYYLSLFHDVYAIRSNEVDDLLESIKMIFEAQTGEHNPEQVMRMLRNPRNAGRKEKCSNDDLRIINALREEGRSIRQISEQTGISKSSVQRILQMKFAMSQN